jgi:hypothetical protein
LVTSGRRQKAVDKRRILRLAEKELKEKSGCNRLRRFERKQIDVEVIDISDSDDDEGATRRFDCVGTTRLNERQTKVGDVNITERRKEVNAEPTVYEVSKNRETEDGDGKAGTANDFKVTLL